MLYLGTQGPRTDRGASTVYSFISSDYASQLPSSSGVSHEVGSFLPCLSSFVPSIHRSEFFSHPPHTPFLEHLVHAHTPNFVLSFLTQLSVPSCQATSLPAEMPPTNHTVSSVCLGCPWSLRSLLPLVPLQGKAPETFPCCCLWGFPFFLSPSTGVNTKHLSADHGPLCAAFFFFFFVMEFSEELFFFFFTSILCALVSDAVELELQTI